MFTHTERATLKTYLSNQIEGQRRKIMPPNRPTGKEFDKVIGDMRYVSNLLTEIEAPKEGAPPVVIIQEKILENENYRTHPDKSDPAKDTPRVQPR